MRKEILKYEKKCWNEERTSDWKEERNNEWRKEILNEERTSDWKKERNIEWEKVSINGGNKDWRLKRGKKGWLKEDKKDRKEERRKERLKERLKREARLKRTLIVKMRGGEKDWKEERNVKGGKKD